MRVLSDQRALVNGAPRRHAPAQEAFLSNDAFSPGRKDPRSDGRERRVFSSVERLPTYHFFPAKRRRLDAATVMPLHSAFEAFTADSSRPPTFGVVPLDPAPDMIPRSAFRSRSAAIAVGGFRPGGRVPAFPVGPPPGRATQCGYDWFAEAFRRHGLNIESFERKRNYAGSNNEFRLELRYAKAHRFRQDHKNWRFAAGFHKKLRGELHSTNDIP